jgi:hypothetical protein
MSSGISASSNASRSLSATVKIIQASSFQHQVDRGAERVQRLQQIVSRMAMSNAHASTTTLMQVHMTAHLRFLLHAQKSCSISPVMCENMSVFPKRQISGLKATRASLIMHE